MTTTHTHPLAHTGRWEDDAACASRLDLPWTRDRVDVTAWDAASMTAICHACPVRAACATAVTDLDITGGWWAGTDRDPAALDPAAIAGLVPPTWRALLGASARTIGAQGALDLDGLAAA